MPDVLVNLLDLALRALGFALAVFLALVIGGAVVIVMVYAVGFLLVGG